MNKAKEEYKKLYVNAESKNMVYITCSNYIDELERQNQELIEFVKEVFGERMHFVAADFGELLQ